MGKDKTSKSTSAAKQRPPAASQADPLVQTAPQWPSFRPALPVADLDPTPPTPALRDKILLVRTFWPSSLCRDYVSFLRGLPLITTPGRPKRGEAVRVNDRFQIDDADFAKRLWLNTGLKEVVLNDSFKDLW